MTTKDETATSIMEKALDEAREVISDGPIEIITTKKVVYDKKNFQTSIKIPKSLSLKAGIDENTEFVILVNPKEETIKNIKSKIVIYKKEEKNGEKTKAGT
jgi:hypothetical protein